MSKILFLNKNKRRSLCSHQVNDKIEDIYEESSSISRYVFQNQAQLQIIYQDKLTKIYIHKELSIYSIENVKASQAKKDDSNSENKQQLLNIQFFFSDGHLKLVFILLFISKINFINQISYKQNKKDMGGSNSKTLSEQAELTKNFKIDSRNKEQNLIYLTHKQSDHQYLLREVIYNDQMQYMDLTKRLQNRMKIRSPNITQLERFQYFKDEHICSNDFRVYSLWQYPRKTLNQQIIQRALLKQPFSQSQLKILLLQIAQGLSIFQQNKKSHECLTTKTILLTQNGSAKVVDVLCTPVRPNLDAVFNKRNIKNIYVSPNQCKVIESQQFTEFTQDPFRQDVFIAAIIMMECALLQRQDDCYDNAYQRINWTKVQSKLNLIQSKYGVQFRSILQSMLKQKLAERIGWKDLITLLKTNKVSYVRQQQIPIINILQPIVRTVVQRQSDKIQTPIQPNIRNSIIRFTYSSNKVERPILQQSGIKVDRIPVLRMPSTYVQQQGIQNYRPQPIFFNYDKIKYLINKEGVNAKSNTLQVSMSSKFTPIELTDIKANKEKVPASTNIPNQSKPKDQTTPPEVNNFSLHLNEPIFTIDEYSQGKRYEGYKLNGKKEGQGKFYLDNRLCFFGNWKDDLMEGFGKLYYQSGIVAYQGHFSKDRFHGFGKLYNQNPLQLNATFNFDNFEDVEQYWSSYQGFFENDLKEGKGQLFFTNGQYFQGNFHEDFVEGEGTYTKITGEKIRGVWHQNKLLRRLD